MSRPGTRDAATSAPLLIHRVVEDGCHTVVIAPGRNLADFLTRLARALHASGLVGAFYDLGSVYVPPEDAAKLHAALQASRAVRDAYTLTLPPAVAEYLAEQLADAALEPGVCASCNVVPVDDESTLCGRCDDHEQSLDDRIDSALRAGGRAS